jgi:ribosomal protein L40E
MAVEEKSMIPTVLVGIGGTGTEILARIRRLVEETYGSLENFPILSFLVIDTDQGYKITNPEASGTPFKDNEKFWARVSGRQVQEILNNMGNYPWLESWFPTELERNITSLEAGAGQIRACGRFAFFCNYKDIESKFSEAVNRVKGHENLMLDRYGIKVSGNAVNVFVTGSLSGGTGSGMLIDLGYCIRNWLKTASSSLITAIVPTPQAFANISVGDRVLANGYAAMMELSYFSDYRTTYNQQFTNSLTDELNYTLPPFDFTYLVGTQNGERNFKLNEIREMIAQNIFLDLTSEFAAHKRSIRDNIKASWAQADPGGRGYSKQFMSFGLSAIEIPIYQIRTCLSNRLATDMIQWWLNEEAILPPQMLELVRGDTLKKMRLTEIELLADLGAGGDRPYLQIIAEWVNSIRNEINQENLLQCTQQGVNMLGSEKGNILTFVDQYLKPKVENYRQDHFRELSTDERLHGDYFNVIYNNRNAAIQRGRKALEDEFYRILEDRTKGPKFLESFIITVRQIFDDAQEKFRREQDKLWAANETNRQQQYEAALREINEFKDKFGISKHEKMEQYCDAALQGLEGWFGATIQRKTRAVGLQVIEKLQEHLNTLETRYNRWKQRLNNARDYFKEQADRQADSADALEINGIKLFERKELNSLYQDLLERLAGGTTGNKTQFEIGKDVICSTMSGDILEKASPFWKETRTMDEIMRLFDLTEIPDVQEEDIREIIFNSSNKIVINSPENSKLKSEVSACDRLFRTYTNEADITNNIRLAYQKSAPLIVLNKSILNSKDASFTPALNTNVAIIGGRNTSDPAAQKLIPKIKQFVPKDDDIKPLGDLENHRIVFVQEIGGFSLRCIDGMQELRGHYQDWKGEFIIAKRAQQKGENRDLPIPVHLQKEPPFWDIFPEDDKIFSLVVQARALGVLRQEENKKTKEKMIRYTQETAIGSENVDIASSWEDAVQVLQIKACQADKNKITTQVNQIIEKAETDTQKQQLYLQLRKYLENRSLELEKQGGKDTPEYKREATIILELIEKHRLNTGADITEKPSEKPAATAEAPAVIFCPSCGAQNPASYKFCSKCGHKLA